MQRGGHETGFSDTIDDYAGGALDFLTFGAVNKGTMSGVVGGAARGAMSVSAQKAMAQGAQAWRSAESKALIQSKEVKTTGAAGVANFKELEKQLGLSSGSGARLLMSSGSIFAGTASSRVHLFKKDETVGTSDAASAAMVALIQIDPQLSEMAKTKPELAAAVAKAKYDKLTPEMKEFLTASSVKQGVAAGGALVAERVAGSEATLGSRKLGWESVQGDLKAYQEEVNTLTDAMGLGSGEAKSIQNMMKNMTESEQMAVGMTIGTNRGAPSEKETNQLQRVIAKELGETGTFDAKTGKMVYSDKVLQRYQDLTVGGAAQTKMGVGDKEALVSAQKRMGSAKFSAAIFGIGEAVTGAQQIAGAGVLQDIMGGANFDPSNFSLDRLNSENIEVLRKTRPELAAIGDKYLAARNSRDQKGMDTYGQQLKTGIASVANTRGGTTEAIVTPGGVEAQQMKAGLDQVAAGAPQLLEALKDVFPNAAKDFAAGAKALVEAQGRPSAQVNPGQGNQGTPR
jgi:hypothetical protein